VVGRAQGLRAGAERGERPRGEEDACLVLEERGRAVGQVDGEALTGAAGVQLLPAGAARVERGCDPVRISCDLDQPGELEQLLAGLALELAPTRERLLLTRVLRRGGAR
jgi:hypothetical protein